MKQLQEDLWQSTIHRAGMLNTHAYFLERPSGNILFYNTGNEDDLRQIAERGGLAYQLLTHRDEAGPSQARIRGPFRVQARLQRDRGPLRRGAREARSPVRP